MRKILIMFFFVTSASAAQVELSNRSQVTAACSFGVWDFVLYPGNEIVLRYEESETLAVSGPFNATLTVSEDSLNGSDFEIHIGVTSISSTRLVSESQMWVKGLFLGLVLGGFLMALGYLRQFALAGGPSA